MAGSIAASKKKKRTQAFITLIVGACVMAFIIYGLEQRTQHVKENLRKANAELTSLKKTAEGTISEPLDSKTQKLRSNIKDFIQAKNYRVFDALAEQIVDGTLKASKDFNIPVTVLVGLMDIESDFRYDVVSSANAVGLTQVHIPTWGCSTKQNKYNLVDAGIIKKSSDLYDPEINIYAGAYILHHYMVQAERLSKPDILKYAMTRYLGGEKNSHYQNLVKAIGEYQVFTYREHVADATQPDPAVIATN